MLRRDHLDEINQKLAKKTIVRNREDKGNRKENEDEQEGNSERILLGVSMNERCSAIEKG